MSMALKHEAVRAKSYDGPSAVVAQSGSCLPGERTPRNPASPTPSSCSVFRSLDGEGGQRRTDASGGEGDVDGQLCHTHQCTKHDGCLSPASYLSEGLSPAAVYSEQCARAAVFKKRQQQHHTHICGSAILCDAGSTSVRAAARINGGQRSLDGLLSQWGSANGLTTEQDSRMQNSDRGAKLLGLPLKLPLHSPKTSPSVAEDHVPNTDVLPNDGFSDASCTSRCLSDFGSLSADDSTSRLSYSSQALPTKVEACSREDSWDNRKAYSSSSSTIGAHSVGCSSVPFCPREDKRSSRIKKLEALQSSGSVLPVTEKTFLSTKKSSEVEDKPLYPLSKMGADRLPRRTPTDPHILPGDAQWFDSVSSRRGTERSCCCAASCTVTPRTGAGCPPRVERDGFQSSGESVCSSTCTSARERQLAQSRSHIFGCTKLPESPPVEFILEKAAAAKELEVRRERRQLNPSYTDLFGRPTPSPVEVGATSAWAEDSKERQRSGKRQEELSAHQRFQQAMQSHIAIGTSSAAPIDSEKRLPIDTHLAMQQRKALTTLTGSGEAFRFHQQSRVFGEPTDGILKKAPPRSTVVLGLSALRPDAQEDDIRKIVAKATDEVLAATRCACTVLLHSDPVTNECKGTGIVSIKHTGGEQVVDELVKLFSRQGISAQIRDVK